MNPFRESGSAQNPVLLAEGTEYVKKAPAFVGRGFSAPESCRRHTRFPEDMGLTGR